LEPQQTIIRPAGITRLQLKELWQYRELLYFFAWRDLKVRYKQTALGVLWALLQPLGMMLIFVLIFSRSSIAGNTAPIHYPVFVLSGLVFWNLFNNAVSASAESMISNGNIIKKIFFPRLVIPISSLIVSLVDFGIAFLLFIASLIYFSQKVDHSALYCWPAAIILVLMTALGFGSGLGALNVKFRDFRYALPFLLQFGFFATAIIYPIDAIQNETLRLLLSFNPVNAAIMLSRAPLGLEAEAMLLLPGVGTAFLSALAGLSYFKKTEAYFADIV